MTTIIEIRNNFQQSCCKRCFLNARPCCNWEKRYLLYVLGRGWLLDKDLISNSGCKCNQNDNHVHYLYPVFEKFSATKMTQFGIRGYGMEKLSVRTLSLSFSVTIFTTAFD